MLGAGHENECARFITPSVPQIFRACKPGRAVCFAIRSARGGGEFVGGRVSPIGAVLGALTLALAGSFLIFMRISPDWQIGAQGAILILVLALRALINTGEARR